MTNHITQSFGQLALKKSNKGPMGNPYDLIQKKTFTKWVNNKLDREGIPHIEDLYEDLEDGLLLLKLLEIIAGEPLVTSKEKPDKRIKKVQNVNKALEFIKLRGVPLTNIGAEDIVDKKPNLILGMLWMIILRFTFTDFNGEGKNAKQGLLLWCQRRTENYEEVDIRNFTNSWTDGLAFCALIHNYRPDLIDFHSLDKNDKYGNTALAFDIAERELNIPKLLDVEDVCVSQPDEKSVMTYVAEYFNKFSARDGLETAGRRVAKFADVLQSVWNSKNQYEQRVCDLMDDVKYKQQEWESDKLTDSYVEAKAKSEAFDFYKSTDKRTWIAEKKEIDALLGNIQTKCKTYNIKVYYPPEGLTLTDLDNTWKLLLENEAKYHRKINSAIREIKERLRKVFAAAANEFQSKLDFISVRLVDLEGDLEDQLTLVQKLTELFEPLQQDLDDLHEYNRYCMEANIEENDYTVHSFEDLFYEFQLAEDAVQKKSAFIQNQIVSRNMTNLTPAQIEEFEQTFRLFVQENTNKLSIYGFKNALNSLGIVYEDKKITNTFYSITKGEEYASFEQFIRFMVSVTEDQTTPGQLLDSFRTMASEKPYVTELDLERSQIPISMIDYLKQTMPKTNSATEDGYDYGSYVEEMLNL